MKSGVLVSFLCLILFSLFPLDIPWMKMPSLKNLKLLSNIDPIILFDFQLRGTFRRKKINGRRLSFQAKNSLWARTFSKEGTDCAYPIIGATSDKGFIVASSSFPPGYGQVDIWISKLSSRGGIEWQRSYEIGDWFQVFSIMQTNGGGYIVACLCSLGDAEFGILKLSPDGNVEWVRCYGGPLGEIAHSIRQTSDGGYIVSGVTVSFGNPADVDPDWGFEVDLLVLKLSPLGDIEWQRVIGGPDFESDWLHEGRVSTIIESSDGGYLLVTDTESFSENWTDIWAVKLTQLGDIDWQRVYGGKESERLLRPGPHVRQTMDGKYIIASYTLSFGAQYSDIWVLKILPNGDIDWQKMYGGNSGDVVNALELTEDDGCIIAGGTMSFGAGGIDFWVLNLSSQGNIKWQKTYGGYSYDEAMSVCRIDGEGFAIAGLTRSFDNENDDLLVIKISPDGGMEDANCGITGNSDALISDTQVSPVDTYVTSRISNASGFIPNFKSKGLSLATNLICWNLNKPPINPFLERSENKSFFVSEIWHTITWSPDPYNSNNGFEITDYKIYRKEREDVDDDYSSYQHLGTVPGNIYLFEDKNVQPDKQYQYAVTSIDSEGNESPRSDAVGNLN